jgi:hypothetical protein
MAAFLVIYGVLLGLILLVSFGTALYLFFHKKIEEPRDSSFVFNFMSNFAASAYGMEFGRVKGKYRDCINLSPRDINFLKYYKRKTGTINVPEIGIKKVWVEKNKILDIPKGALSPDKNIVILLPPNAEDFPEDFKKHHLGKTLMKMTEDLNNENVEINILREGSDRKTALLKRMGDGELSNQALAKLEELHEAGLKSSTKEREVKRDWNIGGNRPNP